MKNKIELEFNKIKTPEELLKFMSKNIKYGYLSKNNRIYNIADSDFNDNWYKEYKLQTIDEIFDTLVGTCFDQVELERYWFLKKNYEIKTIFQMVKLNYKNNYPTHTFLIFKDKNNNWNWFENSDSNNIGIHKASSIDEILNYEYSCYIKLLKSLDIKDKELKKVIMTEFNKPEVYTVSKYLNFVINSKKLKGELYEK